MQKNTVYQVGVGLSVIALVFSALLPESETTVIVTSTSLGLVLVALISFGGQAATEFVKMVLRFAFSRIPFLSKWQPNGAGSAFLALLVAYAGFKQFDIASTFGQYEVFANLDPNLVSLLGIALTWVGSSVWHSLLPEDVNKAQNVG